MKKFRMLPLLLIAVLVTAILPVPALAAEAPEIAAVSAVVADAVTGEVYYAKAADERVAPASTTKMVTALLTAEAIERGEIALTDMVAASDDCAYNLDSESTNAGPAIVPGEEMSVEDLLYCAMLVSANEACNILAEHIAGSVGAFVNAMNARAAELGCSGTHFANANGLEEDGHYTTAADFARIAVEIMKHPLVLEVCGTLARTVPATNVEGARELKNTNSLINPDSDYYYEGVYGVKTGFFTNAGYCLVSACEQNDVDVVCVVMGSPELGGNFADTRALLDWVYANYEYRLILGTTETLMPVDVKLGTEASTGVRASEPVSAVLPVDYDSSHVQMQAILYHERDEEDLVAPVSVGQVLGEVTVVEVDDQNQVVRTFGTTQLVATASVDMSRMEYIRSQVRELLQTPVVRKTVMILLILLALYLVLVLFYTFQRARHLNSMRRARKERAQSRIDEEVEWLEMPEPRDALPGEEHPAQQSPAAPPPADDDIDAFLDEFFKK